MRPHVREFVRHALACFVAGRPTRVVEVGSRIADGQADLSLRPVVAEVCGGDYLGVDMQAGEGVDVVADIEHPGRALDEHWGAKEVVICCDTLEHVRRPWVAMKAIYDMVRANGLAFVAVPFMFQIHEHPQDYYRFTESGLDALLRTYFHDVWTVSDPPGSLIPHTVYAVARRGFPLTKDERAKLDAAAESWLTHEDSFVPRPNLPTTLLQFQTPEAMAEVMGRVKHLLAAPEALAERYARLCDHPSDINEHLPTLFDLAKQCGDIVEMGTRGGVSTTALLAGLQGSGGRLTLYDIDPRAIGTALLELGPVAGDVDLQGVVGDTLGSAVVADGLYCDMLFIDTLHTYAQLSTELSRYGTDTYDYDERQETTPRPQVRKFIVLHDTTTFGLRGEDGREPGLNAAIEAFLRKYPDQWKIGKVYENNNGLTVLERVR